MRHEKGHFQLETAFSALKASLLLSCTAESSLGSIYQIQHEKFWGSEKWLKLWEKSELAMRSEWKLKGSVLCTKVYAV